MSDRKTQRGEEPPPTLIHGFREDFKKPVLRWNCALILLSAVLVFLDSTLVSPMEWGGPTFNYSASMLLVTIGLGSANLIAGMSVAHKDKDLSKSFMVSSGYVWLIGPGLCFGGWPILENI